MNLYFAPLEGITTFTYRNIHNEVFGGTDAYFAPFITPSENEKVNKKGIRDILPENNTATIKAQVLSNNAESFLKFCRKIKEIGFNEININLGCPSSTVVKKGRGSGFLKEPKKLETFFEEVFLKTDMKISVKTRTGYYESREMNMLMEIYNKYPISLLTIHSRTREDYYKGIPDDNVFFEAFKVSKNEVCYNGNIFSVNDYKEKTSRFPNLKNIMIGRGAIANPAIFREIKGGNRLSRDELLEFSERLCENYLLLLGSDTYTLNKIKEVWLYMMWNFPEEKKILKNIKKSEKLADLMNAVLAIPEIN